MRTWLSLVFLLSSCTGHLANTDAPVEPAPAVREPLDFVVSDAPERHTEIVLSEGEAPGGAVPRSTPADARVLRPAAVERLLSRLPPLETEVGDQVDFARRDDSLPPPQVGETIDLPFPPDLSAEAPEIEVGPLTVLRWAPEGEVPIAPQLSVTFSQPMVAVGTLAGASESLPVRLSPEPPGQWRWIGTQTLLFEPVGGQFPKATDYTVSVPAQTDSAVEGALADDFTQRFSTPPLRLVQQYPQGSSVGLQPLVLLGFDQQVDPATLAGSVAVTAGRSPVVWRYATEAEIAADESVLRQVQDLKEGRFVVLRPEAPLPLDTGITVTVSEGAPSAEGPRTTSSAQALHFQTYGPMAVTGRECGYRDSCQPWDSFELILSNPVDLAAFEVEQVQISPVLEGAQIWTSGNRVYIGGTKAPLTAYTVTLSEGLVDVFGQQITGDRDRVFKVKKADRPEPYLSGFAKKAAVLDPSGAATLPLQTMGMSAVDLRVYRVEASDWPQWWAWQRYLDGYTDERATPPGELIHRRRMPVVRGELAVAVTELSLSEHLNGQPGQLVVWVQPTRQPTRRWDQQHATAWVQSTQLGISAIVDATEMIAWVTDLATGAPVSGAAVSLRSAPTATVKTDATGLARLPLPEAGAQAELLVVRKGEDLALLPEEQNYWSGGSWQRSSPGKQTAWFVFDDRQMYRPGEQVAVKGWLRAIDYSEGGDVSAAALSGRRLSWRLIDAFGNDVTSGTADITPLGGFHLSTELPETMNLGQASFVLELSSAAGTETTHYHTVQVQEFRRPEFEASVTTESGPHFLGETATASAEGRYYAGGALPGAPVRWSVTATEGHFTPPDHDDYQFGRFTPWWRGWGHGGGWGGVASQPVSLSFEGTSDGAGAHHLDMAVRALAEPFPLQVTVSASITDVNRQTWSSSDALLVHPSAAYVGLRSAEPYYDRGEAVSLDLVVVDVEGERLSGRPVSVSAVRSRWVVQKDGSWVQEEAERHSCAETSAAEAVPCLFTPEGGGTYEVVARTTDAEGRPSESHQTIWVTGAEPEPERTVGVQDVTLVPDRDRYAPGDTAEILVQSPIVPSEALITWRRQGVVHVERRTLTEASEVITVPVEAAHMPNLHIQVDVVGAAKRSDPVGERADLPSRPAQGRGSLELPVSTLERTLTVEILPGSEAMMPGSSTPLSVRVTDAAGVPVSGAEVAVVAVDESVLALSGYTIGDPMAVFYPTRAPGARDYASRDALWLADPAVIGGTGSVAPTGGTGRIGNGRGGMVVDGLMATGYLEDEMDDNSGAPVHARRAQAQTILAAPMPPTEARFSFNAVTGTDATTVAVDGPQIALRSNFDPLAMFAPSAPTGPDGVASLTLVLPDNLTRYRITAVAVAGGQQFGRDESVVTARLPVMLRPSPPRFLNFGDRFELPVIVQNQTDEPMEVAVAVRASNALLTEEGGEASTAGRAVTVAAGDRVELRFPAAAAAAGTARFQFAVSAGDFADAAEVSLPVWTPATAEAFATYGQLDGDDAVRQPIRVPDDVWPQFGGLEVTTSTTAVGALTDAVVYLVDYPYGCSEQLGSRVLAIAALRDVLEAFDAEGLPPAAVLEAAVAADIVELGRRQNRSGGFGFWRRGDESWPFVSLHVAHALVRADEKGFAVPEEMMDGALRYLRSIRSHVPAHYGAATRRSLEAYALYVRHLAGDRDSKRARALLGEVALDKHPLEALGWLLPVLDDKTQVTAIHRLLDNRVSQTAAAAHFVTDYGEEDYLVLHSSRRTDGVLLDALIRTRPEDPLIPQLVEGLLGSRVRGRWSSTQDNAFVLLALDNYFNTFEKIEPDLVARVWLGERFVGEQAFAGRSTDRARIDAPMGWLQEQSAGDVSDVIVANDGAGRLYYRVGMRYAPKSLDLAPLEAGFAVERRYEAVDDPDDVQKLADGSWEIRAGARVRVKLTLAADGRRSHVALVDPLPAGLEVLNPVLAVTEDLPPEPTADPDEARALMQRGWWWWRPWYDHENIRDDRVEAFAAQVYGGVYAYSYVARATTPGHFIAPPARAEEMYHPETFGRTATERVVIVDR
ncbi:MAG: hypothetical protein ACI8S6_000280 [Myxococcota bacterium]|jgi:uncharacterized protein YfaS (alpha-2-macroglobulin family)